jgi:cyclomaltodextrinase / maltogenic alpha-amylase / neopullulanase
MSEPSWVEHAVWWHVFPLGFVAAEHGRLAPDAAVQHRLPRLVNWLDYAVELGASGLLLGPVFESSTHGYDTVDHLAIDGRLGDDADFDEFVAAAHERGIRVMLDGVFNHVGRDFAQFQEVLRDGSESPAAQWFHLFWSGGSEPDYDHFEGHRSLVTLNHESPAVVDYVVEVLCHWLDRGVDAWRLDAAYAVPPSFWATVLPRVRERHPDAYFVGEVLHGDYAEYVLESGLDSVTQYELWKSAWSSINDRNFHELAWNLSRHDELLDTFVPLTFVGNHDVTRIASRIEDPAHLAHALVILFTVGGTPCVYYGDEQGFHGVKEDRAGGDDAVRPEFPGDPSDLSPLGQPVLDLHRRLISLRRRHPWLHRAHTSVEHVTNDHVVLVSSSDGNALTMVLNLADTPCALPAPGATSVLEGEASLTGAGVRATASLPPHGWAVLSH